MFAKVQAARANLTAETLRDINFHYRSGDMQSRRDMENAGVIRFGAELIMNPNTEFAVRVAAWRWLQNFVIIDDLDDPRETGVGSPIQICQKLGVFPHAALELQRSRNHPHIVNSLLSFVSWCAQDEACIPELVATKAHLEAIMYVNQGQECPFLDQSMAVIRALTAYEGETRSVLRNDGALDCVLPFVYTLQERRSEVSIRRGFRAASIVIRLSSNNEHNVGWQVIRGDPMLVFRTLDLLNKVIEAGPTATVYNMGINPHLITMDLALIAQSKESKPLLKGSVPLLISALLKRGPKNSALVKDVCKIFCELQDDDCLRVEFPKTVYPKLQHIIDTNPFADKDTKHYLEVLRRRYVTSSSSSNNNNKDMYTSHSSWLHSFSEALKRVEDIIPDIQPASSSSSRD